MSEAPTTTTTTGPPPEKEETPSKRRRIKPEKFSEQAQWSNREEELFQQALANSRWEKNLPKLPIDPAPTFYPTQAEFVDPLTYIESIRPKAEQYGICKIVPPEGSWSPPCAVDMSSDAKFATKRQRIDRLQESLPYSDGQKYTLREYKAMADAFKASYLASHDDLARGLADETGISDETPHPAERGLSKSEAKLEEEYFRLVDECAEEVSVEYGNDVDVHEYWSGFPRAADAPAEDKKQNNEVSSSSSSSEDDDADAADAGETTTTKTSKSAKKKDRKYYESCGWNLNNIAKWPGSVLKHFDVRLPGINCPWLYVGMLFSTFSWHNEDNYLASINYHHFGECKQWYGVPGDAASSFENVVRRFYKQRLMEVPDLLHHMNTMFSPSKLKALDVPVYKATQRPGEFIVTFPRAFHAGFSLGFNCGEAVNFAAASWIPYARAACERYRRVGRLAVFGHDRLVFTLARHVKDLRCLADVDELRNELGRLIDEESNLRARLYEAGVRDVSSVITPPQNVMETIDAVSSDYDDKRVCCVCRHTCFLSAVACNCSQTSVACLRHPSYLCKCPPSNKYLIEWEPKERLDAILKSVDEHRAGLAAADAASGQPPASSDAQPQPASNDNNTNNDNHASATAPTTETVLPTRPE